MGDYPKIFVFARHAVSVMVALLFVLAACMKWFEMPIEVHRFDQWGYPLWFMQFIATLESCTALTLLFSKTRIFGAGLGLSVLLGAACTHAMHQQWGDIMGAAVTGSLLVSIVWLHWHTPR
jgi:hypothetical protein